MRGSTDSPKEQPNVHKFSIRKVNPGSVFNPSTLPKHLSLSLRVCLVDLTTTKCPLRGRWRASRFPTFPSTTKTTTEIRNFPDKLTKEDSDSSLLFTHNSDWQQ